MVDEGCLSLRRILADDQRQGAVRIHVIRSVLRIVLDNEDRRVIPVRAVGNGIGYASYRQIVVGDGSSRRGSSAARPAGVIVRQVQQDKLR